MKLKASKILLLLAVVAGAFTTIVPFLYMIATALTKSTYDLPYPPILIQLHPSLKNFVKVLSTSRMGLYMWNTLYLAVVITVLIIAISSLTAYAFARFQFPGKEFIYRTTLFTLMVPGVIAMIPTYLLLRDFHLLDSHLGYILLSVGTGIAGSVFMLRGYFEGLPRELEEAVLIDGGGRWTIFRTVMLPLSLPALAAIAAGTFLGVFTDYLWPMLLLKPERLRTAYVGLQMLNDQHAGNFGVNMAGNTLLFLPTLLIFILAGRFFLQGLTDGSVKG